MTDVFDTDLGKNVSLHVFMLYTHPVKCCTPFIMCVRQIYSTMNCVGSSSGH